MIHRAAVIISFIVAVTLAGCDLSSSLDDPADEERSLTRELTANESKIVEGSNDFAFRLLHTLNQKEGNESFFVSPLSISMAFGMALNGAENETYEQMRDFFGYEGMTRDEINEAKRELIDLLSGLDPQVIMNIANSVWYREGVTVKEEFLNRNRDYFDAEVRELDFGKPEAPDIINAWIEEKTESLIEEMIDQIGANVVMYLINAIYFNGDWTIQFDPEETRDEAFHLPGGGTMDVPLMRARDQFRYYMDDEWTALDMWYGDAGFSFTALIPSAENSLEEIVPELSMGRFTGITEQLKEDTVQVYVPRFELDYEIDNFKQDLIDMGLTYPFGHFADFTGITEEYPLEISDVMHRAVIKLDEEGSEAAAVTVIEFIRTSGDAPQIMTIRLDRPFLFFIRENTSNTILFMGAYSGE